MGMPYDYQLTLRMMLDQGMAVAPHQIIKYRDQVTMTYSEHYARVKKLSNALKTLGVEPGDVLGILEWDTHRFLECLWAVPLYGCMLHTINARMTPEQIVYCINQAEDKVLFVFEEFLPLIEANREKMPSVKKIVVMTDSGQLPATSLTDIIEYETLLQNESDDFEFPEISENTRATLCFTSGTTGNPKGVVFTHRQLVLHALAGVISNGLYPHSGRLGGWDVYMPLTPMFHVQAWTVPYFAYMLGMKMVFPGRYEPELILKLMMKEKVTLSHCVTTLLHMIVFHPAAEQFNLRGWRVLVGGSQLNRQLAERAQELGILAVSAYGMTETCPAIALANLKQELYDVPDEQKIDYRVKSGIPWCFSRIRVVDEMFNDVPHDGKSVGQVVVRTPWATHEYYREPAKTSELWANGWLNTGDLATMDELGYLNLVDRKKDAIKSGGEWISTLTLEDCISRYPKVLHCGVIGVPDPKWGERPAAYVVLKPGQTATGEEIKEHLLSYAAEGKLEKWWIPEKYFFIDDMPFNGIGKIDKIALRNRYQDDSQA